MIKIENASNGYIVTLEKEKIVVKDILELLVLISCLPIDDVEHIKKQIETWKGEITRTDDTLVLTFTKTEATNGESI